MVKLHPPADSPRKEPRCPLTSCLVFPLLFLFFVFSSFYFSSLSSYFFFLCCASARCQAITSTLLRLLLLLLLLLILLLLFLVLCFGPLSGHNFDYLLKFLPYPKLTNTNTSGIFFATSIQGLQVEWEEYLVPERTTFYIRIYITMQLMKISTVAGR